MDGNSNLFNSERSCIDTANGKTYGAIAYYKDDEFLLVNYDGVDNQGYAEYIRVDLGTIKETFDDKKYKQEVKISNYVTIRNLLYAFKTESGYLKDAHYGPVLGCF